MSSAVSQGFAAIFRPESSWPKATCPDCAIERSHPLGGSQRCYDCESKHATHEAENQVEEQAAAELKKQESRRSNLPQLLERVGVPKRYRGFTKERWEASFQSWSEHPTTAQLIDWSGTEPEEWLVVLYGKYGRRKTSLATALFSEQVVRGRQCVWVDMNDWIDAMQAGFDDGTEHELYQRAATAEVLLMDDVGAIRGGRTGGRKSQSWWKERVASLIRHREMECLATIVTGNFESIDELGEIDRSLPSRMDVPLSIVMEGPDFRHQKGDTR